MRYLRLCCFFLPLAAFSVPGQEPAAPASATAGSSAQSPAQDGSTKPAHVGGPVLPPKIIHSVDPKYRRGPKDDTTGTVQIYLWVDENGNPSHVRVVRGLGNDMDESAVEAVRQYKFKPATRDGVPVKVDLYIDVTFQIA